jgi:phosphotriesterase-related protein
VIVRTVVGDVSADTLGVTYAHEHVILDSEFVETTFPEFRLFSVEDAIAELRLCAAAGVGTMVDAIPGDAGRDIVRLTEVSRESGVRLVATTGVHTARWYPDDHWSRTEPATALASRFVADLTIGADGTEHRCGIIKVATLGGSPDPVERGQFEAAAEAHRTTGAPIITHCEGGEGGMGQVETFSDLGVPLHRVVLSHTDKVKDLGYHRDVLDTGVRLEYDQALRHEGPEPNPTANLIESMVGEGHADQILLGTDAARRTLWTTLGGSPGLAWLIGGFAEILDGVGIDDVTRRQILVTNPADWLAWAT